MNKMIIVCHSPINNTGTGLIISLCSNANPLVSLIPRITSNFRHLLSCGTIEQMKADQDIYDHVSGFTHSLPSLYVPQNIERSI